MVRNGSLLPVKAGKLQKAELRGLSADRTGRAVAQFAASKQPDIRLRERATPRAQNSTGRG
jgi:hypothetical protein